MVQRRSVQDLFGPRASEESQRVAEAIHSDVRPRAFIPIRRDFLRSQGEEATPLQRLYSGGRGGRNALLLYLGHMWLAASPPYEVRQRGAYGWAQLLDLDPDSPNALRSIHRALAKLADQKLIALTPRPGKPPSVRMLREDGSGRDYYFPGDPKTRELNAIPKARDYYLRFPTRWWRTGVLPTLSGPELVMLLIMIDAGADESFTWLAGDIFKRRYRLSPSTRYEGVKGLVSRGLLKAEHIPVHPLNNRVAWEAPRKRHQHALNDLTRDVLEGDSQAARSGKRKRGAQNKK